MYLGFQAMCVDLGEKVKTTMYTDSAGIIGRRGLGKVRHIDVGYLWLQDLVARKRLQVRKLKGTTNPADLGTKFLKAEDILKNLALLSCRHEEGRS